MAYDLAALASLTGTKLQGDPACIVDHVDTLLDAGPGSVSFLSNKQYLKHLPETKASVVILHEQFAEKCPGNALISENPYLDFTIINRLFNPVAEEMAGIHTSANIDPTAKIDSSVTVKAGVFIGKNCIIAAGVVLGENCVIGNNVDLGEDSRLLANVTICDGCVIGKRCLLHPGAVIGSDGFGLANDNGVWLKIPQLGSVHLGDDVEIGANSTIDRGAIKNTEIANGVKIDNLVQIAHNVKIGEHTAIAAQTGIAGSSTIGSYCTMAGHVAVAGHLKITDHVHISGMTGIIQSVSNPGQYTGLMPALPHRDWQKNAARLRKLDELSKKVRALEKQLASFE